MLVVYQPLAFQSKECPAYTLSPQVIHTHNNHSLLITFAVGFSCDTIDRIKQLSRNFFFVIIHFFSPQGCMTNEQLWQAVLGELELLVSRANFSTWFKDTSIASLEEDRVVIRVPNAFTKAWLEKKYNVCIVKALQNITHQSVREVYYKVEFLRVSLNVGAHEGTAFVPNQTMGPASHFDEQPSTGLNARYTFQNYIIGKGNELAHAASLAVASNPGKTYNPLFIYGGVGLGKTHLLQAIGHKIIAQDSKARVMYVTCERFTNEYIHAVRNGKGKEFNDTYRSIDLLLVDDIQFITGKEGTQEAFFHTFNTLHQENKQIVITSDRPPKAIATLEGRMLSRFEWGMIADISNPDLETRIAILESKCQEKNLQFDREILTYVCSAVQSNVRELEGALNRIVAYHDLHGVAVSAESVRSVLSTTVNQEHARKTTSLKNLINTVAGYYDLPLDELLSKSRMKRLAVPRQIIMYLMREELRSSYPTIGHELGGRDHTTAIHAYEKISRELQENDKLRTDVELIKQRLYVVA